MKAPFFLVSLAYMLELPLGNLIVSYQRLSTISQVFTSSMQSDVTLKMLDPDYMETVKFADDLLVSCKAMGMAVTAGAAERVCADLTRAVQTEDGGWLFNYHASLRCRGAIDQLHGYMINEAKTLVAMMLPAASIPLYEQRDPLFGANTANKFPSLSYDIEEAGKCLALGRSTAAVFHALRCLEAGFAAMWRCLGIADPLSGFQRNWSNRRDKVAEQIEARWLLRPGGFPVMDSFSIRCLAPLLGCRTHTATTPCTSIKSTPKPRLNTSSR